MGSYPTEGANAQTRSEQNRMDCRMTHSSINDEVTQMFFDYYMSTWIGVVSGVIARETGFILDYWSVPLHYTAGSTAQWLLEATQVVAVSAQTQGRLREQGFATTTIPDYSVMVYNQAGAAIEAIMSRCRADGGEIERRVVHFELAREPVGWRVIGIQSISSAADALTVAWPG
jgi:hypothetical protein